MLLDILIQLNEALMAGETGTVTRPLLKRLVGSTKEHFADEEKLMAKTKYPELAAHRAHHVELTHRVLKYVSRYDSGEVAMNLELIKFLREWLINHILREDMEYGPWMNKCGVY